MLAGEQRAPRGTTSASWMGQKTGPGHWRPPGTGGRTNERGREGEGKDKKDKSQSVAVTNFSY